MGSEPGTTKSLTEADYDHVRDAAETYREVLVVRLCGEVGLRPTELTRLSPNDVEQVRSDSPRYLLRVPADDGRAGDADGTVGGREDPARRPERTAYLPVSVEREIRRYVRSNGIGDDERLFGVTPRRLQMLVAEVTDRAAERTGAPSLAAATSADLRRYFARTSLVDRTVNPRLVKAVGGWKGYEAIEAYLPAPTDEEIVTAFGRFEDDAHGGDGRTTELTDGVERDVEKEGTESEAGPERNDGDGGRVTGTHHAVARRHRAVTDALLESATHEQVEIGACEALVDGEAYDFAWIDRTVLSDHRRAWRTSAGIEPAAVDRLREDAEELEANPSSETPATDGTSGSKGEDGPNGGAEPDGDSRTNVAATIDRDRSSNPPASREPITGEERPAPGRGAVGEEAADGETGDGTAADGEAIGEEAADGPSLVTVTRDVTADLGADEPFAGDLATVELAYGDTVYGALSIGTERPDAFGDVERAWLETIGRQIGYAVAATRRRKLLLADSLLELEFRCRDERAFFVAASARLDCRFELISLVGISETTKLYYLHLEGAEPGDVFDLAAADAGIEDCRLIETRAEGWRIEIAVSGSSPALTLTEYGATVTAATFDDGVATITAESPADTDLRTVVGGLRSAFPDVDLRGKRDVERSVRTAREFREGIEDRLTGKQESALRAAYFAGYYDWPRESTAEEVADAMDISSPTLHNHLRKGQHELLRTFFDEEALRE